MKVTREDGYTLVELLTVMVILGTVMGGLTTLFVHAANAEVDLNNRFQAQQHARLALDKLRRETHCASQASVATSSSVTLALGAYCATGSGSVTWCTVGSGSRYGLYRKAGTSCDSSGIKWADHLTTGAVFTYVPQSTQTLSKLRVALPVNVNTSKSVQAYELVDEIALRNSVRANP
ncbi:MAG: type II secretion system GspH family protein [Actinomycetota bacterium]|nr:type II secretion system GspH family protein [Actinomycetota bacterium]